MSNYIKSVETEIAAPRRRYALARKTIVSAPNRTGKTVLLRSLTDEVDSAHEWSDPSGSRSTVVTVDPTLFPTAVSSAVLRDAILRRWVPSAGVTPSNLLPEQKLLWQQLTEEYDLSSLDKIPGAMRSMQARIGKENTAASNVHAEAGVRYQATHEAAEKVAEELRQDVELYGAIDKQVELVRRYGPTIRWKAVMAENPSISAEDTKQRVATQEKIGLLRATQQYLQTVLRSVTDEFTPTPCPCCAVTSLHTEDLVACLTAVSDELQTAIAASEPAAQDARGPAFAMPDPLEECPPDFDSLSALGDAEITIQRRHDLLQRLTRANMAAEGANNSYQRASELVRTASDRKDACSALSKSINAACAAVLKNTVNTVTSSINRYMPPGMTVGLKLSVSGAAWEVSSTFSGESPVAMAAGSERAAMLFAVSMAWAEEKLPVVLLLDDESIASLDNATFVEVLRTLDKAVDTGTLAQVVVATWRDIPSTFLPATDWSVIDPRSYT